MSLSLNKKRSIFFVHFRSFQKFNEKKTVLNKQPKRKKECLYVGHYYSRTLFNSLLNVETHTHYDFIIPYSATRLGTKNLNLNTIFALNFSKKKKKFLKCFKNCSRTKKNDNKIQRFEHTNQSFQALLV